MVNHEYPFFNRLLPSILLIYVYPSTHARAHSLDFIFKAERVFDPSTNLSLSLSSLSLELSSNYNECFVIIKTYAGDHRRGSSSESAHRVSCTYECIEMAESMLSIVPRDFIIHGLDE